MDWPDSIFNVIRRSDIVQVGYVPDAGHSRLIQLCREDAAVHDVLLTTEEEGVGLAAGAYLGGQRAALLMQSSGVGNCVNMFSLLVHCKIPCLLLVTMRGEYGELNPWQIPMGSIVESTLRLAGFLTYKVETPGEAVETVDAACQMAFTGELPIAVLFSQRMIGPKRWDAQ